MTSSAEAKHAALTRILAKADQGVVVAFSGGVDSTLLLWAAVETCPGPVVAATVSSPLHPQVELDGARKLAVQLRAEHVVVNTHELEDERVRSNPDDRCYHCKRHIFEALLELAKQRGLQAVVEGTNQDDVEARDRPGFRAVRELGVGSPLAEAGLTKSEIRELARSRGLASWDKPALACLASRIPFGEELAQSRLERIERAEAFLSGHMGLPGHLRLRDHGPIARIEVDLTLAGPSLLEHRCRTRIVAGLKQLGYTYVALDLEGYRSGAMSEGQ